MVNCYTAGAGGACYAETMNRGVWWFGSLFIVLAVVQPMAVSSAESPQLHHQDHPEASPVLARYDFEEPSPSGPDTFWVRESGDGEVALSNAFRFRGERSLHITEVPGNRDFAEFLAYFRECRDGAVFVQFYLLLTDPEQQFNFGLAGPRWFLSREQDGQAIWLQTDKGFFRHQPHGGWEDLFEPRSFAWYFIDIVYHVDRGTYDLAIFEEGLEDPVVDLRGISSMNGQERSAVRYFSLIGDLEDAGRFDFFVDDLLIATDPAVLQKPFVAPGRREYFVDLLRVGSSVQLSEQEREDLFWKARGWLDELAGDATGDRDGVDLERLEAAADEAFRTGELDLAASIYQRLGEISFHRVRMDLKLADIKHLRGDVDGERVLRESIYGRLEYEEHKLD